MFGGVMAIGNRGGLMGLDDIPAGAVGTADLANDAVTNAKLRNSGACSVIGRSANSAGDPADISASTNNTFLGRAADALSFQSLVVTSITDATLGRIPVSDASTFTTTLEFTYLTASGTLDCQKSHSGSTTAVQTRNTSNTASSSARLLAEVGGASGGNPSLRLSVAGVLNWDLQVANASSDRLELLAGATTVLTALTTGEIGIGVAPSAGQHLVLAAATAQFVLNATSNDATFDLQKAGTGTLRLATGATDQTLSSRVANHNLVLASNGTGSLIVLSGLATERLRVRSDGDVVIGNGNAAATVLATDAAAGFLRITTSEGPPTGAAVDGAIHVDVANDDLYFRASGAWKRIDPDA